jgi:hypothetical protein
MKRAKKIAWVLLGTAVVLIIWSLVPQSKLTGDDLKFDQLQSHKRWEHRINGYLHRVPVRFAQSYLANLQTRIMISEVEKFQELQNVGYFTNVTVEVTNWPSGATDTSFQKTEITRRIRTAYLENVFYQFISVTNACAISCRPKDFFLIQQAVNRP